MLRRFVRLAVVLSVLGLNGCTSKFQLTAPTLVSVALSSPANTTLLPGQTAQFSASVSNTSNTTIIWEVNSIVGGNGTFGTISPTGLYTAPSTFPTIAYRPATNSPSGTVTVTITAAAAADTSMLATATVTLIPAPTVSLSPATANVFTGNAQQFTATVTNAGNTNLTWQVNGVNGGNTTAGTITSTGLYTAPAVVPSPAMVTITALSVVDAASSASASVTILATPVVTVAPPTASVMATKTQQFTATVSNNTPVNWQVNGISGGNASLGTVSASGLYMAPAVIPNPATVTITAASAIDPASTATADVTITPLLEVTVMPPNVTLQPFQSQTFTATSTIPNDTVTWKVNNVTGGDSTNGTITQTGVYTAPDPAPTAGYVTVEAYSNTTPSIFGSAIVSIGTTNPSVNITPPSASVAIANTQQFSATVSPSTLPQTVTWQVNGVDGGNSTVGTIDSSGLYTAPLLVPSPATVTITAISTAHSTITGSAAVTVTLPTTAITVSVSPTPVTLTLGQSQQFQATVTPSNNPNVTWSMSSTNLTCDPNNNPNACGGITAGGLYTAPSSIPDSLQSASVNVIATSQADTSKSGSASVTVTASPTITITPSSTTLCTVNSTTCTSGNTQSFSAQLAHVPSGTAVSWTLGCINADDQDGDQCGNGDNDELPAKDGPGTITPPSGSSLTNTLTVTYTSPLYVFFSNFPSNACPAADSQNFTYAYVPLTASMVVNNQTYSKTVCIKVTP